MSFGILSNQSDFNRAGNLKTNCDFAFMGEIQRVSVKEVRTYRQETARNWEEGDKQEPQKFALSFSDCWGFEISYFTQSMTQDRAFRMAGRFPIGKTISITGKVVIRKGKTYFNAKSFKWPDDTWIDFFEPDEVAATNENKTEEKEGENYAEL